MAATVFMGLNPHAIPLLSQDDLMRKWSLVPDAWEVDAWSQLEAIALNDEALSLDALKVSGGRMSFTPALGWCDRIELSRTAEEGTS